MGSDGSNSIRLCPHRDSVETSISPPVSVAIFPPTFRTSVESFLKQWRTTESRRHKLTDQSDAPCGQLRPLRQATSHKTTCDVLRPRKYFAQHDLRCTSAKEILRTTRPACMPRKYFTQHDLRCTSAKEILRTTRPAMYFGQGNTSRRLGFFRRVFK